MKTAMLIDTILRELREKVSEEVQLTPEGLGRYQVFTPFCFNDGDHLTILLKQDGTRWYLSDEAHTSMRLSFDIDCEELLSGPRKQSIADALSKFQVEDRNGELQLDLSAEQYGDALDSFIRALLAITESGKQEVVESLAPHSSSLSSQE